MKAKALFAAAAVLLAAASCMETTLTGPDREIAFMPVTDITTKAPIAGTTFPTARTIYLTAHYNAPAAAYTGEYFRDIPFNRQDGTWKGGTAAVPNPKYWPQNGTLDFLAYSVADNLKAASTVTYGGTTVAAGLTFTMGDNRSIQDDILFAGRNAVYTPTAPVQMTFRHAQAQVAFTGLCSVPYNATTNTGITVTRITLAQAYYAGKCAVTRSGDAVSFAWSDLASRNTRNVPGITAVNLTATAQALGSAGVLLPQQSAVAFTIYYTLHNGFKADGTTPLDNDLFYTYTPAAGTWACGNRYVYDISFTLNEITVSPSVTDWVEPTHTAVGI